MESPTPSQSWERTWRAIEPYVGFVQQLSARYRWASNKLGSEDADDLLQEFCLERLPRVLKHLERIPADERDRYLAAAFHNFVTTHLRRAARYREVLHAFVDLDQAGESPSPQRATTGSEHLVLSPMVTDFFAHGVSIRDLSRKFGVSRYAARKAVVDGALLLALSTSASTDLSRTELAVSRLVLVEHFSLAAAAKSIGITETEAKRALASSRKWINQQLR